MRMRPLHPTAMGIRGVDGSGNRAREKGEPLKVTRGREDKVRMESVYRYLNAFPY